MAAEYTAINGRTGIPIKAIFRIDTETGRVWIYFDVSSPEKGVAQGWKRIAEEYPNDPTGR